MPAEIQCVRFRKMRSLEVKLSELCQRILEESQLLVPKPLQIELDGLRREASSRATVREPFYYGHQLKILAQNGWFISIWNTPLAWLNPLAILLTTGQKERANRRLRIHFNQQADGIEAGLAKAHPRRRLILQKAFRAHRNRDYELSVPMFLIQADGIAREVTGIERLSIYSRKDSKLKRLKQFVDSTIIHETQRQVLELVLMAMPLNVSTGNPILLKRLLNRHEVLHGVETDYGSATNSCRAISWLQYIGHFAEAKDFADRKRELVETPDSD
jgi:hypothetical protein